MAVYKKHLEEKIGLAIGMKVGMKAVYSEATFKRIAEDAVFFRRKAAEKDIDGAESKRYSRIVILLMAFYLESLANLFVDAGLGKDWEKEKEKGCADVIVKLRAIHKQLYGVELALDTDGIQDVFSIRNRVIAHPAGRSKECTNGNGWKREDRVVSYKKFTDFPSTYSRFTPSHADRVLEEVKDFLARFHDLLLKDKTDKIPKDILNACRPGELLEWSKEAPKH
ncbi:MAG TPA: hypothetical protein VMW64_01335 [Dehalococcoidia bacterium]|nr:hypothetical protein [Dehalococcoidia bacterium]